MGRRGSWSLVPCIFGASFIASCDQMAVLDLPKDTATERGRVLYQGRRCINCHGYDGQGIATFPGGPRVVGRTAADLDTVLITPCADPSGVTNCHPVTMPDLTTEQLSDLEVYLADLAGRNDANPGPVCDDVPGNICTIAGNGVSGNRRSSDVVLARDQYLFWPQDVVVDPQNRPVINDWNNYTVRRIESTGCVPIKDVAGNEGLDCPIVDLIGTGALGDSCTQDPGGPVLAASAVMNHVSDVNIVEVVPGRHDILLGAWHQWKIKYIPLDEEGNSGDIYCLFGNDRGTGADGVAAGYNFDGRRGPTLLNLPSSVVYDHQGNFYIADQGNLRIRIVSADADDDNSTPDAFVRTHQNNLITRFAGGLLDETGNFLRTRADYADSGDGGPVSECTFNVSTGFDAVPQMRLAMDSDRNLMYVADSENHRIRVIDLNNDPPTIDTFVGGGDDLAADYVPATQAKLHRPADVDVVPGGSGDLLITDTFNHCVRYVDFETRIIHTVAGICGQDQGAYEGDGGPALGARVYEPGGAGIAVDGTIYIADTLNHRVRRVNPSR